MKEASGELNMTVVTIVAVAAVGALFYIFVWPIIQRSIVTQTCSTSYGEGWHAVSTDDDAGGAGSARVKKWICCPAGTNSGATCVDAD